ncbi:hypothetical protein MMPV_004853 [Pyropia vietnamensis]
MLPQLVLLDLPDALLLCIMAALPPLSIVSLGATHPHFRRLALDVGLPAALAAAAGVHAVDVTASTVCGGDRASSGRRAVTHLSPAVPPPPPPPPQQRDGSGSSSGSGGSGGSGGADGSNRSGRDGSGGEGNEDADAALAAWSRLFVWVAAVGAAGLAAHELVTRGAGSTLAGVALRWGVTPGLLASVNGGEVDRLQQVLVPHPFDTPHGELGLGSDADGSGSGNDGGGGGDKSGSGGRYDRRHGEVVWFAARRRYFLVRVPPPAPRGATTSGGTAAAGGRDGNVGGVTADDAAAVAVAAAHGRPGVHRGTSTTAVPASTTVNHAVDAVDAGAANDTAAVDAAAADRARRRAVALLVRGAGVSPEEAAYYLDDAGGNLGGALRAAREDASWAAAQILAPKYVEASGGGGTPTRPWEQQQQDSGHIRDNASWGSMARGLSLCAEMAATPATGPPRAS